MGNNPDHQGELQINKSEPKPGVPFCAVSMLWLHP